MIGTPELLIILLIVVLLFGSTKIPQLGDALGRGIKNFKSSVNKGNSDGKNSSKESNSDDSSSNSNDTEA